MQEAQVARCEAPHNLDDPLEGFHQEEQVCIESLFARVVYTAQQPQLLPVGLGRKAPVALMAHVTAHGAMGSWPMPMWMMQHSQSAAPSHFRPASSGGLSSQ